MKIKSGLKYVLALSLGLCGSALFGHDVFVHQKITENAVASALENLSAYAGFLDAVSADCSAKDAADSMIEGSTREDDPVTSYSLKDAGGWRSLNHFYDPLDTTYGKGLSDFTPDFRVLEGISSFAWGSISNSAGISANWLSPINTWSWQNARGFEWLGLTATNQSDRITALAEMFRSVGQVMHLLEDTSQPQHVRNEQHLDKFPFTPISTPWRSPIEDYGNENRLQLNYQHGMLSWKADGFTKLEDFWDRHLYAPGSATVLNAAENGGAQLGLAEWCNGNFLGARHQYGKYFTRGSIS